MTTIDHHRSRTSDARALPLVPELVRAVLSGAKTVTRRPVRRQPASIVGDMLGQPKWYANADPGDVILCPYGAPSARLWIRERALVLATRRTGAARSVRLRYVADGAESDWIPWPARLASPPVGRCIPNGVHREGARLFVEVTEVRVERVQDITEEDARAEGVVWRGDGPAKYRAAFQILWNEINEERAPWPSNPWVWVIGFKRVATSAQEGAPSP
jgi:hypothetical protein